MSDALTSISLPSVQVKTKKSLSFLASGSNAHENVWTLGKRLHNSVMS